MTDFIETAASVDSYDGSAKIIHEAIIPLRKAVPKRFEGKVALFLASFRISASV